MGYGGESTGGGASNLSLIASCANSTVSLLTCH
ncbi:SapB/AmfS family lanthipeptide [Actinokineospora soli]|uniref:SapB/AmfS family lanthipeptide n=1 Tax=Actinokineospora soli TaxID=1048753 RepID=A0ABW2TMI4_9PSEU